MHNARIVARHLGPALWPIWLGFGITAYVLIGKFVRVKYFSSMEAGLFVLLWAIGFPVALGIIGTLFIVWLGETFFPAIDKIQEEWKS